MAHSDDEGLVLPPRVAPTLVAIIPIFKTPEEQKTVNDACLLAAGALCGADAVTAAQQRQGGRDILSVFYDRVTTQSVIIDGRDNRPGDKQFHWEQRGVPLRIEIGPRDVAAGACVVKNRVTGQKETVKLDDLSGDWLRERMDAAQAELFARAKKVRDDNTHHAGSYDELKKLIAEKGGFVRCFFNPSPEAEAKIKEETKATVRCIPFDAKGKTGKCVYSGAEGAPEVIFAVAY
jgi:prolyl-tRNA synthetase